MTIAEDTSKFEQEWKNIANMSLSHKNTSECSATKDLLYVFGGGIVK